MVPRRLAYRLYDVVGCVRIQRRDRVRMGTTYNPERERGLENKLLSNSTPLSK